MSINTYARACVRVDGTMLVCVRAIVRVDVTMLLLWGWKVPADGRVLQCMQNMQNIQGIPVVPAVLVVCARACAGLRGAGCNASALRSASTAAACCVK